MERADLTEHNDRWTLHLAGWTVNRCCIDFQFRLQSYYTPAGEHVSPGLEVTIETSFSYSDPNGATVVLDPDGPRHALAPALDLFNQEIADAVVWKTGTLELSFTGGHKIVVEPHRRYEAWQVSAPDGLIVCMPGGGEPAIWQPGHVEIRPE